jgi:hypothetical protein
MFSPEKGSEHDVAERDENFCREKKLFLHSLIGFLEIQLLPFWNKLVNMCIKNQEDVQKA